MAENGGLPEYTGSEREYTVADGTVSMNNAELAYKNGEVYVKSTEPKFNKDILKDGTGVEGDTVAYGDDVSFILNEMNIPSYSDAYTTVTYKIDDNLDTKAFKGIKNVQVYVGGTEDTDKVTAAAGTYTITGVGDDSTSFTVAFASDYIKAHAGQSVVVTYDSQFTSPTAINYSEHKNTATLTYSNDPKDASSTNEITDTTYHYTFGIDADLKLPKQVPAGKRVQVQRLQVQQKILQRAKLHLQVLLSLCSQTKTVRTF